MKLVKQSPKEFQYELQEQDAESLRFLVKQFPIADFSPAVISRTDAGPKSMEREKLIHESLRAHRDELKRQARALVRPEKFKIEDDKQVYRISPRAREFMLQILNDIRVESWRILGEPDDPEAQIPAAGDKFKYYHFMR
ncbi:MAG: hypothetical protein ACREFR_09750, partial [Limisphaerales bacterium]